MAGGFIRQCLATSGLSSRRGGAHMGTPAQLVVERADWGVICLSALGCVALRVTTGVASHKAKANSCMAMDG